MITTAVRAVYEGGVFKPCEPVQLEEHVEVEVLIPTPPTIAGAHEAKGWQAMDALIGCIEDAPSDMAENHDFYLYGRPRR